MAQNKILQLIKCGNHLNAVHLGKCGTVDTVGNRYKAPYAHITKLETSESKLHQKGLQWMQDPIFKFEINKRNLQPLKQSRSNFLFFSSLEL